MEQIWVTFCAAVANTDIIDFDLIILYQMSIYIFIMDHNLKIDNIFDYQITVSVCIEQCNNSYTTFLVGSVALK